MKRRVPARGWFGIVGMVAGALVLATSCDTYDDVGFVLDTSATLRVDKTTWTAHITADLTVGVYLYDEDAHAALEAVRIVDHDDDPMAFTVTVTVPPEDWPLVNANQVAPRIVHVEADASVPEARRSSCVSPTMSFEVEVVTDYGAGTLAESGVTWMNLECS
jgi:hypothetical protein